MLQALEGHVVSVTEILSLRHRAASDNKCISDLSSNKTLSNRQGCDVYLLCGYGKRMRMNKRIHGPSKMKRLGGGDVKGEGRQGMGET